MNKSIFSIPLAVLLTFLHVGCCFLPLFSIAVSSNLDLLGAYKSILMPIQLLFFCLIIYRLFVHYSKKQRFCGRLEKFSYHISLFIVTLGLVTAYYEPFKTEKQQIAQQQFYFFKTHRQLQLQVTGEYDREQLKTDLRGMEGIKPGKIHIDDSSISLTFQSDRTSSGQIMQSLQDKGYDVAVSE